MSNPNVLKQMTLARAKKMRDGVAKSLNSWNKIVKSKEGKYPGRNEAGNARKAAKKKTAAKKPAKSKKKLLSK